MGVRNHGSVPPFLCRDFITGSVSPEGGSDDNHGSRAHQPNRQPRAIGAAGLRNHPEWSRSDNVVGKPENVAQAGQEHDDAVQAPGDGRGRAGDKSRQQRDDGGDADEEDASERAADGPGDERRALQAQRQSDNSR